MPLVPETKIADDGKLINVGILLVRKVTWFVFTTMSATLIFVPLFSSRLHDKNCLYILSSFQQLIFPFRLTETTRSLTLRLTETTLSFNFNFQRQFSLTRLSSLTSSSQPHEMCTLCNYFLPCSTFTVRLASASKITTEISSNHRKKQTTNMGEDTFLLTYIIKIL